MNRRFFIFLFSLIGIVPKIGLSKENPDGLPIISEKNDLNKLFENVPKEVFSNLTGDYIQKIKIWIPEKFHFNGNYGEAELIQFSRHFVFSESEDTVSLKHGPIITGYLNCTSKTLNCTNTNFHLDKFKTDSVEEALPIYRLRKKND